MSSSAQHNVLIIALNRVSEAEQIVLRYPESERFGRGPQHCSGSFVVQCVVTIGIETVHLALISACLESLKPYRISCPDLCRDYKYESDFDTAVSCTLLKFL